MIATSGALIRGTTGRPMTAVLQFLYAEGQARAGEAAVDHVRPVLDLLESALHGRGDLAEVGRGEVAGYRA
ncbi:hypothetical protein AB0N99_34310 [Streptomyces sp. NPDC093272]|uniref:hypothetical protein n=1 Tax=Streptomyces sp. NPDC093272 TaxID=3154981 RepID=UPI0034289AB9